MLYALAEAGARRLRQMGVPAVSGKDIVRGFSPAYFHHRAVANEISIAAITQGFRVSTEREIAQDRWVGGAAGIAGKKPDVLMNDRGRMTWVEVERSVKWKADFDRLVVWVAKVGNDTRQPSGSVLLGDGLRWNRLVFVCTPAFEARLRRALVVAGWRPELLDAFVSFVTTLYTFEDISFA